MRIEILLVLTFFAMFSSTFLRGFQNKNVAGGHRKLAFICGWAMALLDGLTVLAIAHQGMAALPFTAFGAAFGWVAGMGMHDILLRRHIRKVKAEKKAKRERWFLKQMEKHSRPVNNGDSTKGVE